MKQYKKKLYRKRLIKKLIQTQKYYLRDSLYRCGKYKFCAECTYGEEEPNCEALNIMENIDWVLEKITG